jgi:hypothetical protein
VRTSHRIRLVVAFLLAILWCIPSYLLVGGITEELAQQSRTSPIVFLLAWFFASTVYLLVLRRLLRGPQRRVSSA